MEKRNKYYIKRRLVFHSTSVSHLKYSCMFLEGTFHSEIHFFKDFFVCFYLKGRVMEKEKVAEK